MRYEHFDTDEIALKRQKGVGTNEVEFLTFGVNWYWNPLMKLSVNYYRAFFDQLLSV